MKTRVALLVTGSRKWPGLDERTYDAMREEAMGMSQKPLTALIIHGDYGNADMAAKRFAEEEGLEHKPFPPDWSLGGKGGPIRNSAMVSYCLNLQAAGFEVRCLALWDGKVNGSGTFDCFSKAIRAGIPVRILPRSEP